VQQPESILNTLTELAALAVQEKDMVETADAVVALAMQTVECDFAGLTVFSGRSGNRKFRTLAPTDALVVEADELQYALREGPCVEAATEHDTFVSNDVASDPRWPSWGPRAAGLGIGSLLATRLAHAHGTLGSLNLYSRSTREFTIDDRDFAQVFAAHATTALVAVRERHNLRVALDARTLIGQAQGILMERFGLDAPRAFSVLRRYSQTHNVKLREVAEEVVGSRALRAGHLPPPE
jgi:GAF domain-containing protein